MTTARNRDLTLRDKLSRLTYTQACRMLGVQGKQLLLAGGRFDLPTNALVLASRSLTASVGRATVRISLGEDANGRVASSCSACDGACEHLGAVLSLILEEKLVLGLARPPIERTPVESLGEEDLILRARADREERARSERMTLRSSDPRRLWTDYTITSAASGKTYRLALRGETAGESYCSCPDFRKNTLGTCKHILHALAKLRRRFKRTHFSRPFHRKRTTLYLSYVDAVELRVALPK